MQRSWFRFTRFCTLIGLAVLIGLISGGPTARANGGEVGLTERDSGRQIELAGSDVLAITLDGNRSTGYSWQVAKVDNKIIRQAGPAEYKQLANRDGAPDKQTLRFAAVGEGETQVELVYSRPWEKDVAPAKTFAVRVRTRGPFTLTPAPEPEPIIVPLAPYTPIPRGDWDKPGAEPMTQAPQDVPASWNWCDQGVCTPIKNQGQCGSCWAFATVGPLEINIRMKDLVTRDLSEQYLVSCNDDGWSCSGGGTAHPYHWNYYITGESGPGAVYETDLPYQAADVACNPPHTHHERITSWQWINYETPNVDAIKQAIYDYGPVKVSLCTGSAFQGYHTGIFATDESADCSGGTNHAVVLVGWDDNQQFWYLRNSWGPNWGESGYMRIRWGTSGVGKYASYVVYPGSGSVPNPPSALGATAVSQTQINLSWTDNSTNETGFRIERCQGAGCTNFAEIGTVGANATTYNNTGLGCGTTYRYQVRAYNGIGNSSYSNIASATTSACSGPNPPSNLGATAVSQTEINLSWTDNSTNEMGFRIERCQGAGCTNFSEIGTVGANVTTYNNTGLGCGTTYRYQVRAYNGNGNSSYSSVASATTSACGGGGCSPARTLTCGGSHWGNNGAAGSTDQINLYSCSSWDESGPEYTYTFVPGTSGPFTVTLSNMNEDLDVFVLDGAGGSCSGSYCLGYGNTWATVNGQAGHTYYLVVDGYEGVAGNYTINLQCSVPVPNAPSTLAIGVGGHNRARLTWTDNSTNETGFEVERSPNGSSNWTTVGTPGANSTTHTDSGLAYGTSYYYRVCATNAGGDSGYTNVVSIQLRGVYLPLLIKP